jgi:hypothetical protein
MWHLGDAKKGTGPGGNSRVKNVFRVAKPKKSAMSSDQPGEVNG